MSYLEKNLAAIETHTPQSAAAIRNAQIPSGFERGAGTDSSQTFLRTHTDPRRLEWLGGTSAPASTANAMISALVPGVTNGLGLSIGTGHEWRVFIQRLGPAQALLIYEPDPTLARMALAICDLSSELAVGKIVLLVGLDAENQLASFLGNNIGYDPPAVLHPLASLAPPRRNDLVQTGEAMVRRVLNERQQLISQLLAACESSTPTDATLAITTTPAYPAERPLHQQPAANHLRIDHFATVSAALRLKTLADLRPARILSDFFRSQLQPLPANIPVETWIPPLVSPGYWRSDRFANTLSHDRIILHFASHRDLLAPFQPVAQIELRPLAIHSEPTTLNSEFTTRSRLALIADVPPCDTASLRIDLPTHQQAFAAARAIIEEEFLTVTLASVPDLLRRALARVGASANDESLSSTLSRIIRDILLPGVPPITLVQKLRAENLDPLLIGNWPAFNIHQHWSPDWPAISAIVHLSPLGTFSPLLLEAAARDIPIIAPLHPTDSSPGSLPTIVPNLHRPTSNQLLPTLKRF